MGIEIDTFLKKNNKKYMYKFPRFKAFINV